MAVEILSPAYMHKAHHASVSHETTTTYPSLIPPADVDSFDKRYGATIPTASRSAMLELETEDLKTTMPLLVLISYSEGIYEIEHQEFGVFGRGVTTSEAVEDFVESLVADYIAYAEEDDENMDKYAQELANRYRRVFIKR